MNSRTADTFTTNLAKPNGKEQEATKTTLKNEMKHNLDKVPQSREKEASQ